MTKQLLSCEFEVFGRVQGVFFRKFTLKKALELKLTGFVMNTRNNTVKGEMEGNQNQINEMKHWLTNKGSPSSSIDEALFSEMKNISENKYKQFSILH